MPILDDTGQSPSITEGPRALRLFTDRYNLIRMFARSLHEDDALGKILYFQGGGGNGKSLLVRYLKEYACKRFQHWGELRQQPDAEVVERLTRERVFDPLPVAILDFRAPPREFEQPMVDYDALLMVRRQLGAYSAERFSRLRFPVYDFAALWYLHHTGRLTEARLSSLFPSEEINFVLALAQLFKEVPGAGVATAALGLFNKHLKERWTLYKARRGVDPIMLRDIQDMDPERDLIPELPRLLALDINAALSAEKAPPRIVLLFDGHDAFANVSGASAPEDDRDRWLRYLLASVDLKGGVVPVVTSRRDLRWEEKARYAIPSEYLDSLTIGNFTDIDAQAYLKKAGVDDLALRARLCDYARVAPYEVHPLFAGLGADVALQAFRRGQPLTAENFPEEPDTGKKQRQLVETLLEGASGEVEDAVYVLSASRAFDRDLFFALGEQLRFHATQAAFNTLTEFSFVWEAETRGVGWYSIHDLLRRIFRERKEGRTREADAALEAIYRERAEAGDTLALAEAVYHAYQREPERGLEEWLAVFEAAMDQSQYALCEALRTVGSEFQLEDPWWSAEMAQFEGLYLLVRSRYAEADKALQTSVAVYAEVLSRTPNDPVVHNNRGLAVWKRGNLLATQSRHEEAEGAYAEAVAAFDEALSRTPDYLAAHINKGTVLLSRGELLVALSRYEQAEEAYAEAVAAFDEALSHAPDEPEVRKNKATVLLRRGELLATQSRHEEAEGAYADAIAAFDEVLSRAPDYSGAHNNRGLALMGRGDLLVALSRHGEAEEAYAGAVAAFDEALGRAPDYIDAHNNKGIVFMRRGNLLADHSRHGEALEAYADAVAAFDEALSRAPGSIGAYNNKSLALRRRGDLLATQSRHEEAEQVYADAIAAIGEALSRAPDYIDAHNNKGNVLLTRGNLLADLSRHEEAKQAYADAIAAFDEALSRAPDYIDAHNNKGIAMWRCGDLLTEIHADRLGPNLYRLLRDEKAEEAYSGAVAAFDEALSRAPDYIGAHYNKGAVLQSRGDLLVIQSRHEEADEAYADAIAALDEALSRAPDYIDAHFTKAFVLLKWAESLGYLVQDEVTRQVWEAAQTHLRHVLALAPQHDTAKQLLTFVHEQLNSLDAD